MTTSTDPIRVGLLGTGAISQVVHVPILVERKDVELVVLADADPHKAETLSRRFSVPLVMDPDEVLDSETVDAVVLCTPNRLHEEQAVKALEAGKHVLVERPIALTAVGAARVVDAAERAGRILAVGLPHRFRPEVVALRDFIAGGELGAPYAVRGSWLTRTVQAQRAGWRRARAIAGGGALMDLGIAALDLCLWVVGYPKVKRVACVLARHDDEVEDSANLMAETEEGMVVSLEVSTRFFAADDRYYLRVMGEDGSASLPPLEIFKQLGGRPIDVTPRQPKPRGGENPYTNAYRRLLDDFVRCVSGRAEAEIPREQAALMAVIEAAYRAAETGQEVEV